LFSRRVNILLAATLLAGAVLVARLAQIQLGWRDRFRKEDYTRAAGSHFVETVRGAIYAHGGRPLAIEVPSFDLGVYYGKLADDDWKPAVSALCGIPVGDLTARAESIVRQVERMEARVRSRRGREDIRVAERYEYHCVAEDVSPEAAALARTEPERFPAVSVGRKRMPAVEVLERTHRVYGAGALAPHVVGQVSAVTQPIWDALSDRGQTWLMGDSFAQIGSRYKMDDRIGTTGIEKACEGLLRGSRGCVLNRLTFGVLKVQTDSTETPPQAGRDVYLTVREDFQEAANAALARAAAEPQLSFRSGALVILSVRDGSVLAAATFPSYDASSFRRDFERLAADSRGPLLFRPLQGALPPGSVFKVVTTVAALEEGAITPATTFTCSGSQVFMGRAFHCTGQHGTLSLLHAFEQSCNVYFYNTGLKVGGEALARWGKQFGLGVPSGVDLPYERAGDMPTPTSAFDVLNHAIGQGRLLCTPLQVANMAAVIANGGKLYKPHFFDCARDADGNVVQRYAPEFVQLPIRQSTLDVLREGMRLVVASGTARNTGLDAFRVAGKTGTAELGIEGQYHAWFAGYAPYDNPRIAFAVVSERTVGHGGSHAAPIMAYALEPIWPAVEQMP
jgi:penicillin-binding protein 2